MTTCPNKAPDSHLMCSYAPPPPVICACVSDVCCYRGWVEIAGVSVRVVISPVPMSIFHTLRFVNHVILK